MKGTHRLETFMRWLDQQDDMPLLTRRSLKKKMKATADQASASGKQARLDFRRRGMIMMSMRFFDDGSMEVGWPDDLKWYGDKQPFIPPEEKEI